MITIDEAIKVLEAWARAGEKLDLPKTTPAVKLGIEALEAWKEGRKKYGWFYFPLLPGETED